MTKPQDSAFPLDMPDIGISLDGLTKREYFAAMAMQGLMANSQTAKDGSDGNDISSASVLMADALISELNKQQA